MGSGQVVATETIPLPPAHLFNSPEKKPKKRRQSFSLSNNPFFSGSKRSSIRSDSGDSGYASAPSSPTSISYSTSRNSTESRGTVVYTPVSPTQLKTILEEAVISESPRQSICEPPVKALQRPLPVNSTVPMNLLLNDSQESINFDREKFDCSILKIDLENNAQPKTNSTSKKQKEILIDLKNNEQLKITTASKKAKKYLIDLKNNAQLKIATAAKKAKKYFFEKNLHIRANESLLITLNLTEKSIPEEKELVLKNLTKLILFKTNQISIDWKNQEDISKKEEEETRTKIWNIFKEKCNKNKNEFLEFLMKYKAHRFNESDIEKINNTYQEILQSYKDTIKNIKLTRKNIFKTIKKFERELNIGLGKYHCIKRTLNITEDHKVPDNYVINFEYLKKGYKKFSWIEKNNSLNTKTNRMELIKLIKKGYIISPYHLENFVKILSQDNLSKESISKGIDSFIDWSLYAKLEKTVTPPKYDEFWPGSKVVTHKENDESLESNPEATTHKDKTTIL